MRSPFKTVAVALVLALTTATLAEASANTVATAPTTPSVAGKTTGTPAIKTTRSETGVRGKSLTGAETGTGARTIVGSKARVRGETTVRKVSVLGRHRARFAGIVARHRHLAHRPLRNKIVRKVGVTHLAQNHRVTGA